MRIKVKVLELPGYAPFMADELPEVIPVFNRDGFYYIRGAPCRCWAECNGKAYLIEPSHFIMELRRLDHVFLRDCEREALKTLSYLRRDYSSPLRELLYEDDFARELRRIGFESRASARQFFRDFEAYEKEIGIIRDD